MASAWIQQWVDGWLGGGGVCVCVCSDTVAHNEDIIDDDMKRT